MRQYFFDRRKLRITKHMMVVVVIVCLMFGAIFGYSLRGKHEHLNSDTVYIDYD